MKNDHKHTDTPPPRFGRHHIVISIIAILVAFALAANYYLW